MSFALIRKRRVETWPLVIKWPLGVITGTQINVVSYKEHKAKSPTTVDKERDLNCRAICSECGIKQEPRLEFVMFEKNQEITRDGKCV